MKKIVLVGLLITGLLAAKKADYAQVISSDIQTTVIEFNTENFNLVPVSTPEGIMHLAKLENGASFLKKGAPDLHKISRSIIIPDNADMGIEILSSEFIDYNNISIAPSKGNLSRLINPDDISYEFGAEYSQDSFFPSTLAELQNPYILRSLRGQAVDFHPIQYNPIQKVLRVYSKITVKVSSSGDGGGNMLSRKAGEQLIAREYKNIYESHFLNFRDDTRFDYLEDRGNMLVISYSGFMEEMQPLVDWKNKKGVPTEMVNVSDIGSNSSAIENYVDNYYYENGLTFLLLVGDAAQIPSPSISGSASDPSYGFIEGNDSYAEVIVGRFSGSTPAHIATQVERSIEYERSPQGGGDWYDNVLAVASTQGPGFGGYTDAEFNEFVWETVLEPFTYESYQGIYDGGGTVSQGMAAINNGVSLINFTGHGSQGGWGSGATLSTSNVNSLENDNMLPFVVSVACNVGEFNTTNECFAEAWLRATHNGEPAGGIGHLGSTISQSWEPPMHGQYAMNMILTESYEGHITRSMGGIATNGCLYMNDAQGSSGINETNYWTLFGDPSLELRTDQPTSLSLAHDDVILIGQTEFVVDVGVNEGLVALSNADGLIVSEYIQDGVAVLPLDGMDMTPGTFDLVITSFNTFVYETEISVISPDGAYLITTGYELVSESGFDNIISYGDDVEINILTENVGTYNANAILVEVTSADEYITVTDGSSGIAYAIVGAETGLADPISFSVAGNVPDGHMASFDVLYDSGEGDQWNSSFSIEIHATDFQVLNPVLIDEDQNGVLDPGESATLTVDLANLGSADFMWYPGAQIISNSEYIEIEGDGETWLFGIGAEDSFEWSFTLSTTPDTPLGVTATVTIFWGASELSSGWCEELINGCPEPVEFIYTLSIGLPFDDQLATPENVGAVAYQDYIEVIWDEPVLFDCDADIPYNDECAQYVVEIDSYCCDTAWDSICEGEYQDCMGREIDEDDYYYENNTRVIQDFDEHIYNSILSREITGYNIFRDDAFIGSTTFTVYEDSDISASTEYCYYVTAMYEEGQSGPSNTACAIAAGEPGIMGDLNGDGTLNILDIIIMANMALGSQEPDISLADLNYDGIINILDVITLVNLVLGNRTINTSNYLGTDAIIYISDNSVSLSANGNIAGYQMTVKADGIELNTTIPLTVETNQIQDEYVIIAYGLAGETLTGEQMQLFTATAGFEITSLIVANVLGDAMGTDLTSVPLPETFGLSQNFPNPFNPSTEIQFTVGKDELISLNIYDIQGRLVSSLIDNYFYSAGSYKMNWDGKNKYGTQVPSGMYLYKLESSNQIVTRKMVLMK